MEVKAAKGIKGTAIKHEKLGEIVSISKGKKHLPEIDGANRYINIENLHNSENSLFTNESGVFVEENDLIIAWDGANAGKVGVGFEGVIGSTLARLRLNRNNISARFLFWFLESQNELIKSQRTGATIPHVNGQALKDLLIPLPPLATQQRIAAILDAADALRRKDQELLRKYDELAQAIFIDMFGDPVKNEKGWEVKRLGEVCEKITDGEHGTVARIIAGRPYLMARNIRDGFIDLSEIDYVSEADHKRIYKRCNPEIGDILLVCVGATIGRACLMKDPTEFSLARSVALIKPNHEMINSSYLFHIIKSDYVQNQIKLLNNSSAQAGLYTGKIKELIILLPPIETQLKFEMIMNTLSHLSTKLELENSESLFHSLLQQAFSGELVA